MPPDQRRPRFARFLLPALLAPVSAAAFSLSLPVDCALGDTCYIQHYVDRQNGPGLRDYACGTTTYDDHDGTDFALPTRAAMAAGVTVRAAAAGHIRATRDGEPDGAHAEGADVSQKECGNGIVIDHEDGWQTQYCHLRAGSITVKPGERVAAGAAIGLVGQSGLADFPHLHLSVRRNGQAVDPFRPGGDGCASSAPTNSLWQDLPAYSPGGLLQIGLAAAPPDYAAVKAGLPPVQNLSQPAALVLWAYGYESQTADRIAFDIEGPEGFAFHHEAEIDKGQPLFFRYAGKKAPAGGLAPGTYRATVTYLRGGAALGALTTEIEITE
ncbi:MAG: M23 family metallopeptidase [Sphingomonadales bacterium]|nr:M23 family metallopeptidase [Sphingomonadales bacterium]